VQLLFAFLRSFREYIVFLLLVSLSLLLITNSDAAAVRVLRSYTIVAFAGLQGSTNWAADFFSPRSDEQQLRDINVRLLEEVMQNRRLHQENLELRRKIGFRERSPWPLVPAEIVGKNLALGQYLITIDAGERDSVRVNMPIINEEGLVGKVIATSERYSIGMLAMHRDFRVTAKVKRSRIDGIVAWRRGATLELRNIWKTADILPGDTIVTSEYSNIFPPELMIGIVASIGPGEGGLFSSVEVRPRADFAALERVFVIRYGYDAERQQLESRMMRSDSR
jgi:rod shape-determining protein MreC